MTMSKLSLLKTEQNEIEFYTVATTGEFGISQDSQIEFYTVATTGEFGISQDSQSYVG